MVGSAATREVVFLVVDDEPLAARAMARALAPYGRVEQVHTIGDARIALTGTTPYVGVIVDVMLGEANGFEVVDIALRQRPTTPILVVTGSSAHVHAEEAIRRQVPVMRKPVDLSEVRRWAENAASPEEQL